VPLTRTELKHIQTLLSKKGRKQKKMFPAEGVRLLEESIRFEFLPQMILYVESAMSSRAIHLVSEFARRGVRTIDISARQLDNLTETKTPQGIVGIFDVPSRTLSELYTDRTRRILLCEGVADPGNLGTLVRSALAFGFDLVVATGHSADLFAPKVVRASAGSVFGIPIVSGEVAEFVDFAAENRVALLAADPRGAVRVESLASEISGHCTALAIGSEPDGLSDLLLEHASARVRIAHSSQVESLNAAVAGSILMNEIYNLDNKDSHEK
jgi:TrmH family RNA methyltransferase